MGRVVCWRSAKQNTFAVHVLLAGCDAFLFRDLSVPLAWRGLNNLARSAATEAADGTREVDPDDVACDVDVDAVVSGGLEPL